MTHNNFYAPVTPGKGTRDKEKKWNSLEIEKEIKFFLSPPNHGGNRVKIFWYFMKTKISSM